jgi:hypothetical protein
MSEIDPRAWQITLTEDLGADPTEADDALRPPHVPEHARLATTNHGLAWVWEANGRLMAVFA